MVLQQQVSKSIDDSVSHSLSEKFFYTTSNIKAHLFDTFKDKFEATDQSIIVTTDDFSIAPPYEKYHLIGYCRIKMGRHSRLFIYFYAQNLLTLLMYALLESICQIRALSYISRHYPQHFPLHFPLHWPLNFQLHFLQHWPLNLPLYWLLH